MIAAENIAVGDLAALDDRPRLQAAARQAGIHERLAALPRGYDTMLSRVFLVGSRTDDPEVGVVPSGGEQQRLGAARGLLRDRCDVLILDEPVAGLDPRAEAELTGTLRRQRRGRTSLLISHGSAPYATPSGSWSSQMVPWRRAVTMPARSRPAAATPGCSVLRRPATRTPRPTPGDAWPRGLPSRLARWYWAAGWSP